jgi:glutamine synthetase
VLNTIVAEALDQICQQLEKDVAAKKDFNKSLQKILQDIIKGHKRIIYNGDNYTNEWHAEAKKRGLLNLKNTPDSLQQLKENKNIQVLSKHGVLSEKEIASRYEIYKHAYDTVQQLEGNCAATMARTQILPVAFAFERELAETIKAVGAASVKNTKKLLKEVTSLTEKALAGVETLEAALHKHDSAKTVAAMANLRESIDELENLVPAEKWPLPSYAEMLLMN